MADEVQRFADIAGKTIGNAVAKELKDSKTYRPPDVAQSPSSNKAAAKGAGAGFSPAQLGSVVGIVSGVVRMGMQHSQGGQVLNKAQDVALTTVGTAFTPVLTVFAAGVLSVSDYLYEKLLPNLQDWVDWVVKMGDSAAQFIEELAEHLPEKDEVNNVAGAIGDLFTGEFTSFLDRATGTTGAGTPEGEAAIGTFPSGFLDKAAEGKVSGEEKGSGGGATFGSTRFQGAFKDVLTELRLSQGNKGFLGGVAQANKQAQEAAFQSPFERRILKITEDMLRAMEKTASNTGKIQDWEGSGYSGVDF